MGPCRDCERDQHWSVQEIGIMLDQEFRLKDFHPGDTCGLQLGKGEAAELLARGTEWLAEEQDMLYAQDCWHLPARSNGESNVSGANE
jgi:hypothetical protein